MNQNPSRYRQPSEQYIHDVCLMDKNIHEIFYNKQGYKFLELRNFVKGVKELETGMDRWFYLLKNMSRLKQIPKYFDYTYNTWI